MNSPLDRIDLDDIAGWQGRVRALNAATGRFRTAAARVGAEIVATAQRQRDTEAAAANSAAQLAAQKLDAASAQAVRAAETLATRMFDQLCPGGAGMPFDSAQWRSPDLVGIGLPTHLRAGSWRGVPVALPLLSARGWSVSGDPARTADFLRGVVLRLISSAQPGRLQISCFDPNLSGTLGAFGGLREDDRAAEILPPTMTSTAELETHIKDLVATISRRADRLNQFGYQSFEQMQRENRRLTESFRVLVLLDYPAGIDARLQQEVKRVVTSAAGRGVFVLVQHNTEVVPAPDVVPAEVTDQLSGITGSGTGWASTVLPSVRIEHENAPGARECAAVAAAVATAAAGAALDSVSLSEVLVPPARRLARVEDELHVHIGLDEKGEPTGLRLRSSNPPLPNVLIGGAVGQGKSNLLLTLIHGLAAAYAPRDLEMYLLDFKQGLEFSVLGPGPDRNYWLPHARVLGVFADREFGLAVLRHVTQQLEVRSTLFRELGNITDIASLAPDVERRPPRILLVLDEFQTLLSEDDEIAVEATELLEKLVRQGRAYGIHLVLATQTLQGIQRLAVKRDAIFNQVPYRIVLRTSENDSQELLSPRNTAAAGLRFRGQAIVNDSLGAVDANKEVLIAHADKSELADLRLELWRTAPTPPPRIFSQEDPAALLDTVRRHHDTLRTGEESRRLWLGLPVSVEETPVAFELRPEPGAGLVILGDDAATALGVLSGAAVSLAISARGAGDRFLFLDLLPADPQISRARDTLLRTMRNLGADVDIVGRAEVSATLIDLAERIASRDGTEPPIHLLAFGLHRAVRLDAGIGGTARDALQTVVTEGATVGVFLLGWWNRLKSCVDQLGYNHGVGAHLFLRHPLDGIREICGSGTVWAPRPFRGLLNDGMADEPRAVVTFVAPTPTEASAIVRSV
ncbi:FtsK/SpoIIIE domain-containing protein [Nocardia sp. NPDC127579]|uniref:FtsK/SpoIIIE domain-containing protein n=1 Tax=Nocardia sp. NPDC127579 TaxID=3345402 RepID=UPI00363A8A38